MFLDLGTHFVLYFLLLKLSHLNFHTVRKKGALCMRDAGRELCEMEYFILAVAWKSRTSGNCCYFLVKTIVSNLAATDR